MISFQASTGHLGKVERNSDTRQASESAHMKVLQPPSWARPRGFANGIAVSGGTTVYVAGQVGWTGLGAREAKDFAGQFRQPMRNILDVLAQAGGRAEHFGRLTWDGRARDENLAPLQPLGGA